MQHELQLTADGSHTVCLPEFRVTYHSIHGAVQESMHVFIAAGLGYWLSAHHKERINILEMGLGAGLNTLLTLQMVAGRDCQVHYHGLELHPLPDSIISQLNYASLLTDKSLSAAFRAIHSAPWEADAVVAPSFTLQKSRTSIIGFTPLHAYDLVYYDAFAPEAQPELWTTPVFKHIYNAMAPGGVLVTYCCKGSVRRSLMAAGFDVTKLPGPPGKREMLRAEKH